MLRRFSMQAADAEVLLGMVRKILWKNWDQGVKPAYSRLPAADSLQSSADGWNEDWWLHWLRKSGSRAGITSGGQRE